MDQVFWVILLYVLPMVVTIVCGVWAVIDKENCLTFGNAIAVLVASAIPLFNIITTFAFILDLLEMYNIKPLEYKLWEKK